MNTDLNICGSGHDEVCFNDNIRCPVCKKHDELQEKIDTLTKGIELLQDEIEELKGFNG